MVNTSYVATDSIVEQSVDQTLDQVIRLARTVKRSSPQNGRTTMTTSLDQFHKWQLNACSPVDVKTGRV